MICKILIQGPLLSSGNFNLIVVLYINWIFLHKTKKKTFPPKWNYYTHCHGALNRGVNLFRAHLRVDFATFILKCRKICLIDWKHILSGERENPWQAQGSVRMSKRDCWYLKTGTMASFFMPRSQFKLILLSLFLN